MQSENPNPGTENLERPLLARTVELLFPLLIAVFAAMLSINDLLSDNVRALELKLGNIRNNNYQWYQSKGIKATISEGQRDLLATLLSSGAVTRAQQKNMRKLLAESERKVERYNKEKKEILLGSKAVGEENWVQDVNGQFGQIIGAQEYDEAVAVLEESDNLFDLASMLFQFSMVAGAVGIMLPRPRIRLFLLIFMMSLGIAGFTLGMRGYGIAKTVQFFD